LWHNSSINKNHPPLEIKKIMRRPGYQIKTVCHAAAFVACSALALIGFAQSGTEQAKKPTPEGLEFFEKKVRPLLAESCFSCHASNSKLVMGGLRLDSKAGLLKGGDRGLAVVPSHPDKSLLISVVGYRDANLQMPPKGKLSDEKIAILTEWVKMGAPWPDEKAPAAGPKQPVFDLKERAKHWAWQPVKKQTVPIVHNKQWCKTPVDNFILAKLEASGLAPNKPADKRTLLRRVTYDLTGLPPTPVEIDAFLADNSPDAYKKVLDRLLASPHYGERWARHWLDLVRYAETDGHEFDFEKPGAYQYRDYLIRALNADVPYNQFVTEHLAGDLLQKPRLNPKDGSNESIIGTSFYWLGEGKHSPVDLLVDQAERIDNQVDVLGKAFLGLSVGCARCHDHKFDAISTKDYYALCGYMKSSRYRLATIDSPELLKPKVAELEKIASQVEALASSEATPSSPRLPQDAVLFEDFSKSSWTGWTVTGEAFGAGPSKAGLSVVEGPGGARVERLTAASAADSGRLSDRLQGTLRSKDFTIEKPRVLYHMAGKGIEINLVIDGFQRIQYPIYGGLKIQLDNDRKLKWYVQDVAKWVGHRAYIEVLDNGPGHIVLDRIAFADHDPPAESADSKSSNIRLANSTGNAALLNSLMEQRKSLEANIPEPRHVMAAADGSGEDDKVHIRGSTTSLGSVVARRFLEACSGAVQPAPVEGSGRLALAERMIAPSDPLLTRVMVNRIWQHHFGEGIVRTPDDFGARGERPTHPELLDYLAGEFVRQGWSIKQMHRMMVLSNTYQMSSAMTPKADQLDPLNKLVHRMSVRRLEAEAVRDAVLAVSGRLDSKLYGPSVLPYLTPFMEGRGRPVPGPVDGDGRRSIYISVRRNFLVPMFLAFDYPVPFNCMGKRTVSNVPAQALTMMNNPFVVQQAQVWAKRILSDKEKTPSDRITQMYLTAFGRPPDATEMDAALNFITSHGKPAGEVEALRTWSDLCHVLMNVKEFIFID
jgi:hypothetical protein